MASFFVVFAVVSVSIGCDHMFYIQKINVLASLLARFPYIVRGRRIVLDIIYTHLEICPEYSVQAELEHLNLHALYFWRNCVWKNWNVDVYRSKQSLTVVSELKNLLNIAYLKFESIELTIHSDVH